MVVLFNTEGRFGHQLSQLATLMAYAEKYKRPYHYFRFSRQYGHYFKDFWMPHISPYITWFYLVLYKMLKMLNIGRCRMFGGSFYIVRENEQQLVFDNTLSDLFTDKASYVITDYMFNDVTALVTYREKIKQQLVFSDNYVQAVQQQISDWRSEYALLVGVHIRRGDFKHFAGGKYYFGDSKYKDAMSRFTEICGRDKKEVLFLLCSDEYINNAAFQGLEYNADRRSTEQDFLILRSCDYIIATRSIFSTMANYLGDNQIYQLDAQGSRLELSDFREAGRLLKEKFDFKGKKEFI